MKPLTLSEAMICALQSLDRGLTTQDLADYINLTGLYMRKDGKRVTSLQIHWVVKRNPGVFVKEGGIIHTIM